MTLPETSSKFQTPISEVNLHIVTDLLGMKKKKNFKEKMNRRNVMTLYLLTSDYPIKTVHDTSEERRLGLVETAYTSFVLLDVTCSPYGINRMH